MNTSALIGYTGFIGSSFKRHFDYKINSKSIIEDKISVSELVICAPSGLKWKANKQPSEDLLSCKKLYSLIRDKFKNLKRIILISSNDTLKPTCPYGENRKVLNDLLEKYCSENKIELFIFYLGMTFGKNAKKGMVYDFLTGNFDYYSGGVYQLYPVSRIEQDIDYCVKNNIQRALFCSEPIKTSEVKALFGITENSLSDVSYKVKPFGIPAISKDEIFRQIEQLKKKDYYHYEGKIC